MNCIKNREDIYYDYKGHCTFFLFVRCRAVAKIWKPKRALSYAVFNVSKNRTIKRFTFPNKNDMDFLLRQLGNRAAEENLK